MTSYKNIIAQFSKKRILVVGDLILDQYIRGRVLRISPEAPVPIVVQEEEPLFTPGGAANVAHNLSSLGAQVSLVGRIGFDPEGRRLKKELKRRRIDTQGIFVDRKRPTILKTRIIAHQQQIVRLDRERSQNPEHDFIQDKIQNFICAQLPKFDALIISDYGKGVITAGLLEAVCPQALLKKKIVTVDPKVEHFNYYKGVTAITPNRKEAENAIRNLVMAGLGRKRLGVKSDCLRTDEDINSAGRELLRFLELESLLITLGEQGMRLFERGQSPKQINTRAQEVFDVTGAGDTVISVFTLSLTTGASKYAAADLANHAAGIVVGKMGAVVVTPAQLLDSLKK